jgi:hypothetical protein
VIVLDNSAGSLEASSPGQTAWLDARLAEAQASGVPVVVIAAEPLSSTLGAASDGPDLATKLANAGVLGVFTTSGGAFSSWTSQSDRVVQLAPGLPEYEGAALTYQQPQNNGVLWYSVSVDTSTRQLSVQAIPVVSSLALEPLNGLNVARSSTLAFQAIGRRPPGTVATSPADDSFPGFDQYVSIPASTCSGCIGPSYAFTSSDPVVGDFVVPSGPDSPFPKLDAHGKVTRSSTSGLFCAFNSGTTTVSVTSGMWTSSLPVTVRAGGFGPPCGTVPGGVNTNVIRRPARVINIQPEPPSGTAPLPPPTPQTSNTPLPRLSLPPPPLPAPVPLPVQTPIPTPLAPRPKAPAPRPAPAPAPALPAAVPLVQSAPPFSPAPVAFPLIPPPVTPVPPGGATVSAQAAARREEKARKHASQSAFVTRPAGTSATDWFYPAVGVVGMIALLLAAGGLRPGPRQKLALLELGEPVDLRRRRNRR